jgi:dipeptidyl-peptidase-4
MKIRKLFWIAACILIIFSTAVQASSKGTFTLEEVLSPPFPSLLVSAKKADRIAWAFHSKGERNVWTAAAPDFRPVNLTGFVRDEVFEISEVHITDDGRTVVFVKGGRPNSEGWVTNPRSDPDGMEQAIWAVSTDGGEPWKVAPGRSPVLSPDGRWLLLVEDGLIYRLPLTPPLEPGVLSRPELMFKAAGQNGSPRWSPDSSRIAFVSNRNDHSFIGVFDIAKRKITWIAPNVDRDSNPSWKGTAQEVWRFPQEEPLYYSFRNFKLTANDRILFTAEHDNWNHVFSMPLTGGDPVDLTPGEGFVEQIGLSSDEKTVFFSSNLADIHGRHIWKVPTEGGKAVQLTKGSTIGTYPVALSSGTKAAFHYATAVYPTSIATVPADGGKITVVAPEQLPAEFPMDELVIPELVIVNAPDGLEIPCQIFLPKGAKKKAKLPGVVYTHGGPVRQMLLGWHYMGSYFDAYAFNQHLANHGYAVLSVNYRSGIGYGRSFRDAPDTGRRGASEYQDILAGAQYLQNRPEVDPERIGKWGLSYGGLLTAMALARNSDIFKVGVDMAGVHNWSTLRERGPDEFGNQLARDSSPIASLETWKSPVLFIHGDDDRNVPFQQTTDLVQKLRAKGDVYFELMIVPDEPHVFLLYKNRMECYKRAFEFIERFIGK